MSAAETLDDYLEPLGQPGWADHVAADSRADDERFTIDDDGAADWALRKVAKAKRSIAHAEQMAAERRALIDRWLSDSTASDRSTVEFFEGLLGDYAKRVRDDDPDRKTVDLPSGRLKTRESKPAVVIDDLWAVANWCDNRGLNIVDFTPKVRVSDLRKHAEAKGGKAVDPRTGEVVPGLSVRDGAVTVTVEVDA